MTSRVWQYPELWRGCVGAWCPSYQRFPSTTLIDYSGNNNHGTLTGMDVGSDWVASGGRIALDFDGTNDTVTTALALSHKGAAIAAWINTTSSGVRNGIVACGAAEAACYIDMLTDGKLRCAIEEGPAYIYRDSSGSVNTGVWTHVAMSATPTTVSVYVNGINVTTGGGSSGTITTIQTTGCKLGNGFGGAYGGYFATKMDDVRIYGTALPVSNIANLALRRGIAYENKRRQTYKAAGGGGGATRPDLGLLLGVS